MYKIFAVIFTLSLSGIFLRQRSDDQNKNIEFVVELQQKVKILEPELLPSLHDSKKSGKELDSLYSLIDEGTLNEKDLPDKVVKDIYKRMSGGWSESNRPESITATSFLPPQGNRSYGPEHCFDFNEQTAWVEGKEDLGVGESVSFYFKKFQEKEPLTSIIIYNGYQRDPKIWEQNSRVKQLKLSVNNEAIALLNLKDTRQGQKFSLRIEPRGNNPITIKLEIVEAYKGSKWPDTAITHIIFDGEWQGI